MRYPLFFLIFSLGLNLDLNAQLDSDEPYAHEVQATLMCVISGDTACEHSFRAAIEMAKATENDSIIGHCYLLLTLKAKAVGVGSEERLGYLREGLAYLQGREQPCFEAMMYSQIGTEIEDVGSREYMAYQDTAMTVGEDCHYAFYRFQLHMAKAFALESAGDLSGSIKELKIADAVAEEAQDTTSMGQVNYGLGEAYGSNGDHAQAEQHFWKASQLFLATKDSAVHWLSIAAYCSALNAQDRPEKSIELIPGAIDFFTSKGMIVALPSVQDVLARAYLLKEQPDEAIELLHRSSEISTQIGREHAVAEADHMLAEAYLLKGDTKSALRHSTAAYGSYSQQNLPPKLLEATRTHAQALRDNGRFAESVGLYEDYVLLKDSLFTDKKMKEISFLQAELKMEQREKALLTAENELVVMESKHETARNRNLMLGIALLLLAALAYALISRQKLKTAKEKARVQEKEFENERLNQDLAFKNRELSAKALNIAKKNELLQNLQADLEKMAAERGAQECVREVVNTLKLERTIDGNWDQFTKQFTELNPDFYKNLTAVSSSVSKSDLRLAALLRMNLSSKEIASMLNISDEGVKKARQRFRKKLELQSEDSLEAYVMAL